MDQLRTLHVCCGCLLERRVCTPLSLRLAPRCDLLGASPCGHVRGSRGLRGHLLPMHLAHHPRALTGLLQENQCPQANSGTEGHQPRAHQQGGLGPAETRREGRLRVVLWGQGLEPGMKFLPSSGLSEERRGEGGWGTLAEHRFDGSGLQRQAG